MFGVALELGATRFLSSDGGRCVIEGGGESNFARFVDRGDGSTVADEIGTTAPFSVGVGERIEVVESIGKGRFLESTPREELETEDDDDDGDEDEGEDEARAASGEGNGVEEMGDGDDAGAEFGGAVGMVDASLALVVEIGTSDATVVTVDGAALSIVVDDAAAVVDSSSFFLLVFLLISSSISREYFISWRKKFGFGFAMGRWVRNSV